MDNKIVNPSDGRMWGVLFSGKGDKVTTNFLNAKYVDVRIIKSTDKVCKLTGIYGEPKWEDMYKTWDKLRE
jgi:hypothetical protein